MISKLYRQLTAQKSQEDDAKHFFLLVFSIFFVKLGDALASVKIILPWLMAQLGAPAFLIGALVPIRESGALWPQMFWGSWVSHYAYRRWFYAMGCLVQGGCVLLMALSAFFLKGAAAGWSIVWALVVFSLARGLCSVVSKDVLAKVVPKEVRGQVSGVSASAAGIITVAFGVLLFLGLASQLPLAWLLVAAGFAWVLAALGYAWIAEPPGETSDSRSLSESLSALFLLRKNSDFRCFVLMRACLISSALAAPYLIVLAQKLGADWLNFGLFMAVSGLASMASGVIWGRLADQSSLRVLRWVAFSLVILFLVMSLVLFWLESVGGYSLVFAFFVLSILHQGVRVGRSTYVVNLAEGNQRTYYVTVGNTVIGVILLLCGAVTAAIAQWSLSWLFLLFTLMAASAWLLSWFLPNVES